MARVQGSIQVPLPVTAEPDFVFYFNSKVTVTLPEPRADASPVKSSYYLNGNALQNDGPQTTHFLTLNSGITNIKLGSGWRLHIFPAVYYLNADSDIGYFFTATGMLTKNNLPLRLESTINQPFQTDISGSEDFLWNVTLSYFFERKLVKKKPTF